MKYQLNGVPLSEDQVDAVKTIESEQGPFFMTGPAGSGKTFVINYLKKKFPGCIVCAMTGTAAQLLSSTTAHSVLGILPRQNSLPTLLNSKRANERIQNCKLLIIDEISMADDAFIQLMFERFGHAGVIPKVLLVGDMMQLPAVLCRDAKGNLLSKKIFHSSIWGCFRALYLKQSHRQKDNAFLSALNDIRVGNLNEKTKALFNTRHMSSLPDDCVHLYPYRSSVEEQNERRLEELPGKGFAFEADQDLMYKIPKGVSEYERNELERELTKLKDQSRYPLFVRVKEGAQVVLLSNNRDKETDKMIWVNGSVGTVVDIRPDDDIISVQLKDIKRKNPVVEVSPEKDEVYNADGELAYVFHQYPLMLGWAQTIHKSQGQTFDRVGIDLDGHFECGQTYVALSRCRDLSGLFLSGQWPQNIKIDREALGLIQG